MLCMLSMLSTLCLTRPASQIRLYAFPDDLPPLLFPHGEGAEGVLGAD